MQDTKTVLITGIGGAIGSHMYRYILEKTDWDVVGIDSFNHKGYMDRLAPHERLHIICHDLRAPFTEREIDKMGQIDYIINLASLSDVQESINDPVPFVQNNIEIILTVLELARRIKPLAFLHFSTDEVYGPARIDEGHPEWDTILPSNPYAASKAAQEAIAISYWRSYNVPLVITNTMNNAGEMQSPSKFPAMVQKYVTEGKTIKIHTASDGTIGTRYYIHSRVAADAVLYILQHATPTLHQPGFIDRPDRYNIVGDIQLNNLELAQMIAKHIDAPLEYELVNFHSTNPGHDVHYGLDGTKLADLGWSHPTRFEDDLKDIIEWQKLNAEWMLQ